MSDEGTPIRQAIRAVREGLQSAWFSASKEVSGLSAQVAKTQESLAPHSLKSWETFHSARRQYPAPIIAGSAATAALVSLPWGHGVTARNAVLVAALAAVIVTPEKVSEIAGIGPFKKA